MRRVILLVSASACLFTSPVLAADATEAPTATSTSAQSTTATPQTLSPEAMEAAVAAARIERAQRIELNARMNTVLENAQKTVVGLQKMIDATTDPSTLRELEKRMSQVKSEVPLDLLRVQAMFARENGRIEQAEKIEAEIAEALAPKRLVPASSSTRTGTVVPAGGAR